MQITYPDNVRIDLSIRFKNTVNELFGSDFDIDWTVGRICQGEKCNLYVVVSMVSFTKPIQKI